MIQTVASMFSKGASTYQTGAALQMRVAAHALSKLREGQHGVLLDLGAGPGLHQAELRQYCQKLWALDLSPAMLGRCQRLGIAERFIWADASQVPLAAASVDSLFSSLMLQWCDSPAHVFAEVERLLKPGGQFVITTLVKGSLAEFEASWLQAGYVSPQRQFLDESCYKQALQGLALDWQAEVLTEQRWFPEVKSLVREFKQLGANYVTKRAPGLAGKQRWQDFTKAYELLRQAQGLPLSYQVFTIWGTRRQDE